MNARSWLVWIAPLACALFASTASSQAAPVEGATQDAPTDSAAPATPQQDAQAEPPAPPPAEAPAPLPAEPPAPPPAEGPPAQTRAADEPRYDGEIDADGRAHYGDEEEPAYEDPEYVEAEEPSAADGDDDGIPPFSIRIDPFNWLIEGRLGFELEVGVLDFMTIELVPVLVANSEPPSFNLSGRDDAISQESNGIGPIAGASLGVGFWPSGVVLEGYVIRVVLTNYGFTYNASDALGIFDKVSFTERRLMAYFGSHMRFGFFTIAGGIGLGYELNQQQRCYQGSNTAVRSGCSDDGEMHIALEDPGLAGGNPAVADLNGPLHPMYLEGRLSLGVAFD